MYTPMCERNFVEMRESHEKTCFKRTFALIIVVFSVFLHEHSNSLRVYTIFSLKK